MNVTENVCPVCKHKNELEAISDESITISIRRSRHLGTEAALLPTLD